MLNVATDYLSRSCVSPDWNKVGFVLYAYSADQVCLLNVLHNAMLSSLDRPFIELLSFSIRGRVVVNVFVMPYF